MAIDWSKLKTNAANKDAVTYKAETANYAKIKPLVSSPAINVTKPLVTAPVTSQTKAVTPNIEQRDISVRNNYATKQAQLKATQTPQKLFTALNPTLTPALKTNTYNPNIDASNVLAPAKRTGNVLSALGQNTLGSALSTISTLENTTSAKKKNTDFLTSETNLNNSLAEVAKKKLSANGTTPDEQTRIDNILKGTNALNQKNVSDYNKSLESTSNATDKLYAMGANSEAKAKQGLGKTGQKVVEYGLQGAQLATDIAAGAITKSGALPMALRAFGDTAHQAKESGATADQQAAYGGLQAGAVYLAGSLMSVGDSAISSVISKGPLKEIAQKATDSAIGKFIASDTGKAIAARLAAMGETGLSQGTIGSIQAALNPVFQRITYDPTAKENASDIISAAIESAIIGSVFGAVGKKSVPESKAVAETPLKTSAEPTQLSEAVKSPVEQQTTPIIDNALKTPLNASESVTTNVQDGKSTLFPENSLGAKLTGDSKALSSSKDVLTEPYKGATKTDANVTPKSVDLNNLPEMGIGVAMDSNKSKSSISDKLSNLYTRVVDTQSPIADRFAKDAKDNSGVLASNTRNAGGIVNYIFTDNLVDTKGNVIGKSLKNVVEQIPKGEETDFWKYMAQRHNIDRAREGKNVDPTYTSEMSSQYVKNLEAKHPEYKTVSNDVVNWIDKFEKAWGVETGLIGKDGYASLREKYKSYFPTQREFSEMETGLPREITRQFVDPKSPIKAATGSSRDLNNPVENIMSLVNMRVKAARYNEVGQEILKSVRKNPEELKKYAEIVNEKDVAGHMTNNIVSVLDKGERVYLKINDKPFLEALMGLPKNTMTVPVLSNLTQGFKNLITQKNPFFAINNMARDIPTAYTYGGEGNPLKFIGGLAKAGKDVATNSENYQRYKAVGGGTSNFFNSGNVEKSAVNLTKVGKRDALIGKMSDTIGTNKLGKAVTGTADALLHPIETVEKFNNITEAAPRVAEFNRVLDKTGDVQKALDASNNVTVNFARGGDVTKALDRNGVAYLNAGVQGLDKFVRSVDSPRKLATMLVRGGISITAPTLLMAYVNRNDEDYDQLTNYTKDSYYCIPIGGGHNDGTVGNSEFLKIPRSREIGVLMGALVERLMRAAKGEEQSFKGYGTSLASSFAPANPLTSNMVSPIITNLPSNKNFMGSAIVPQGMIQDNRSKYLQYDEKTSEITKFIAKYAAQAKTPLTPDGVQISPKQMDYLIDTYTGVIGDFVLPASTIGGNVGKVVTNKFTAQPSLSNQTITDFYDKADKAKQVASDKNITENINPSDVTLEEKVSRNYTKASEEISALSKVSMRAGITSLTDDDKKLLTSYKIDLTKPMADIQKAVRIKQIEIAQSATTRGDKSDEMELDINNDSDIADSVTKYQSAGIDQKQAYSIYKAVSSLKPQSGETEVSQYQKISTINQQGLSAKQTSDVVATLYTKHDKKTGELTSESLLPYVANPSRLVSLYITGKGKESSLVNMTIPKDFTRSSKVYTLTSAERETYKKAFVKSFNAWITNVSTAEQIARQKDLSQTAAQNAVIQGRLNK